MFKFAGVVAMSVMLMLVACGGQKPVTKTYTSANSGQTITIPATVNNLVLLTGQGAAGNPAYEEYFEYYREERKVYNQRNDQGGVVVELDGGTTYHYGPLPENYCTPWSPYIQNGVTNYSRECFTYIDESYYANFPATTGGSAQMTGPNGFNRTWVGGTGGPASPTTAENVAVVAGGQYVLTIPAGGSITMSYYE